MSDNFVRGQLIVVPVRGISREVIEESLKVVKGKIIRTTTDGTLITHLVEVPIGDPRPSCEILSKDCNIASVQVNRIYRAV